MLFVMLPSNLHRHLCSLKTKLTPLTNSVEQSETKTEILFICAIAPDLKVDLEDWNLVLAPSSSYYCGLNIVQIVSLSYIRICIIHVKPGAG